MTPAEEREYFRLAAEWLACQQLLLGTSYLVCRLYGAKKPEPVMALMGQMDLMSEMWRILRGQGKANR